jgi:3-hydroxyacyl-[acyl-carrier-protein] dehydratase
MELKNILYKVVEIPASSGLEGGEAIYRIELLKDSVIYQAHFPGRPITPGACMIQIVQELVQMHFEDASLQVKHISNLKFLALLEPQHHQTVDVMLNGTPDKLKAELRDGELVFAKLSLSFIS